jgi:NADH:ubiquinone oxidoreductase subunit 4 (subunit M)
VICSREVFRLNFCFWWSVSLFCIRQNDLKSLIAYYFVAHMIMIIGGIMTLSYWGFVALLP